MDDMKLRQEDHVFPCTSVQHIVKERKQDSHLVFGEEKRKKKDNMTRKKVVIDKACESIMNKHEEERDKKCGSENQCGNIIDIEV